MISFVVCIAEHCNLNCASCDHFSVLSEERLIDIDKYSKMIERMADITDRRVERIHIEGGEPLLHPKVKDFLKVTRTAFPETVLKLYTNAILLHKMDDEFWEECRKLNIIIKITKYPIKVDYKRIEELAAERNVVIEFVNENTVKAWRVQKIDVNGKQDPATSYENCYMAHGICAELRDGKLFTCTQGANLDIFGRYFFLDIKYDKEDYIDIFDDVNMSDIIGYLNRPAPMCRYCRTCEWNNEVEWSVSKKSISEWT